MIADDAPTPLDKPTTTDAMQRAFARLVTSPQARARFAVDPHAEAPALAALSARDVEFYARGLMAKRFAEVRRLLPHVARAGGLAERFRAYAATLAPGGHGRHRTDAIAFARTLEGAGAMCGADAATRSLARAARIDRLGLEASRGGTFARLAVAHGHVHVWLRVRASAPLRFRRLGLPRMRRAARSTVPIA